MREHLLNESASGAGKGGVIVAFGQEAHVLVSSQETGDAFCVLRISASPGNVTPAHVHRETDETFLIESGAVEVNRGGEVLRGQTGDVIYLPKGIPHAPRVVGHEKLTLVVVSVPCGVDHFVEACGQEFEKLLHLVALYDHLTDGFGVEA